jgi:hypothetical protein
MDKDKMSPTSLTTTTPTLYKLLLPKKGGWLRSILLLAAQSIHPRTETE